MVTIIQSLATALVSLFWSRAKPRHEILILRHRLNALRQAAPKRVSLTNRDRLLFLLSFRAWIKLHEPASVIECSGKSSAILTGRSRKKM